MRRYLKRANQTNPATFRHSYWLHTNRQFPIFTISIDIEPNKFVKLDSVFDTHFAASHSNCVPTDQAAIVDDHPIVDIILVNTISITQLIWWHPWRTTHFSSEGELIIGNIAEPNVLIAGVTTQPDFHSEIVLCRRGISEPSDKRSHGVSSFPISLVHIRIVSRHSYGIALLVVFLVCCHSGGLTEQRPTAPKARNIESEGQSRFIGSRPWVGKSPLCSSETAVITRLKGTDISHFQCCLN